METEVGTGKYLLRIIRINNDRIHRDIRQVAGLVCPNKRTAVRDTCYLKDVTRCVGVLALSPPTAA
jgi:hypothetical protein